MDSLFGLLGDVGVAMLLLAYFLLTIGHLKATDTHHTVMNLVGALLVVIAMHTGNTVPLFITLVLWLGISLFGLYKHHVATTE